MNPSLQLYSIRKELAVDPVHSLKKVATIGYKQAEGYDLLHLAEIKPILSDLGIEVKSSMMLWSHITQRFDLVEKINYPWIPSKRGIEHEIERALALELDTLIFGYLLPEERASKDDYFVLCERLNEAEEKCREAGIRLLYHNHGFEFQALPGDVVPYDLIRENVAHIGFELDVLWAQLAGNGLADLISKLGSRLKQLHLKSGGLVDTPQYDDQALSPSEHDYPLGTGVVNITELVGLVAHLEPDRLFVEQEYSRDMYQSLRSSFNYLVALQAI